MLFLCLFLFCLYMPTCVDKEKLSVCAVGLTFELQCSQAPKDGCLCCSEVPSHNGISDEKD